MHSDPDFELLPPAQLSRPWRIALLISTVAATVAVLAAGGLWSLQRQASMEFDHVLASSQRVRAPAPPIEPAYAAMAREAAQLMQQPIDDWLRELEGCQPPQARLRDVRVDARAARVVAQVDLQGGIALAPWLDCLNAGLPAPAWRSVQLGAAADAAAPQGSGASAWTVVLQRGAGR